MSDTWTPQNPFGDENSEAGWLLELRDRLRTQQPWRRHAACVGLDPAIFFPTGAEVAEAVAICDTCQVRRDCLRDNLRERDGVWGGTSGRERERLRKGHAA